MAGTGFKLTIKKKSLPTRPLNVRVQATPESTDVPVMSTNQGEAAGYATLHNPAGKGGGGLPSSKKGTGIKKISGPRGQYK